MELDTEYDLIILGTGLVESVIAGAAARSGKKVLHLDYNDYYGGYAASNTLSGFEKLLTSTTAAINAQPDKWPSQNYTCIPAATNPAPKFHNVKIYAYDPPTVAETTQAIAESPKENEAKPETTTAEGSADKQIEGKKDTNESEEKRDKDESEKKDADTEEKKETIQEKSDPRSNFESREKVMASSRQYTIDTIPRLAFSRGEMVSLLISSSVGRYLEFCCFKKTFMLAADSIQQVPCSKTDIFVSKHITNFERLKLTKFMKLIHDDLTESTKIDATAYGSFYDFIKSQKLSPHLENIVLYAISMCTTDQQSSPNKVSTAEGLRLLELYVSSVSKYGNTPFLCPMYGVSELPQAFCRLCAVYAGIYVLRRSVQCLLIDNQTNQFKGVVCSEGQTMYASHFVSTGSYFPQLLGSTPKVSRSSRCVVISSVPIVAGDAETGSSRATLLIIPPLSPIHSLNNPHAIHVLQFDQSISVVPRGKYILHFSTEASETAEQDLGKAVAWFFNLPQMEDSELVDTKPYAHWVAYFNLNTYIPDSPTSSAYPQNVYIVGEGPRATISIDYKEQLEEAREVFRHVCPNEEFLPRVPDPEDIIWVGSSETQEGTTTQTETDNNGNGGEVEDEKKEEYAGKKEETGEEKEEKEEKGEAASQ